MALYRGYSLLSLQYGTNRSGAAYIVVTRLSGQSRRPGLGPGTTEFGQGGTIEVLSAASS